MLKYAILGLLNREPLTGYDISQKFNNTVCNFWYSTHGQIYPALKRLNSEGLISFETGTKGTLLKKKFYQLTDEGREELSQWISTPLDLEPTAKDSFRLQLFFTEIMGIEESLRLVKEQKIKRTAKLSRLQSKMDEKFQENPKFGSQPNESLGDYLVLKGAVMREESYVNWLDECETVLERFLH